MSKYKDLRISQFFYYYGPGSIFGGNRIYEVGIIPNLNDFITKPQEELSEVENPFIINEVLFDLFKNRTAKVKKLLVLTSDRKEDRAKDLKKDFFKRGWKICRNKFKHKDKIGETCEIVFKSSKCPICGESKNIYPFYFIGACLKGHLCQPNWWNIVHYENNGKCNSKISNEEKYLKFYQTGISLEDASLKCPYCSGKVKLIQLIGRKDIEADLKRYLKCCGNYPEDNNTVGKCNETLVITRYISTYLRYSVTYDFIFFPVDKMFLKILELVLKGKSEAVIKDLLEEYDFKLDEELFKCFYEKAKNIKSSLKDTFSTKYDIHLFEYMLLKELLNREKCTISEQLGEDTIAINENLEVIPIDDIKQYTVLLGYKRIDPDKGKLKPTYYEESDKNIFVALEKPGEALFFKFNNIELDGDRYRIWKNLWEQIRNTTNINTFKFTDSKNFIDLTPEYVYLHTFAHLIIRSISKLAGFSIANLKDRIYLFQNSENKWEGGVLIYVSGEDADGSLGGLVSLCKRDIIENLLNQVYNSALDCSNDPACENQEPIPQRLFGSACTVCSFLPETACGYFNLFLDRILYLENPIKLSD